MFGGGGGGESSGSTVLCYCSQLFKDYTPYPLPSLQSSNGDETHMVKEKKKSNIMLSKNDNCSYLFLFLSGGSLLSLSNPGLTFRSNFSSSFMFGDKLFLNSFSK